jgi:hypothetical protein
MIATIVDLILMDPSCYKQKRFTKAKKKIVFVAQKQLTIECDQKGNLLERSVKAYRRLSSVLRAVSAQYPCSFRDISIFRARKLHGNCTEAAH